MLCVGKGNKQLVQRNKMNDILLLCVEKTFLIFAAKKGLFSGSTEIFTHSKVYFRSFEFFFSYICDPPHQLTTQTKPTEITFA